jgi:hypothetical protein
MDSRTEAQYLNNRLDLIDIAVFGIPHEKEIKSTNLKDRLIFITNSTVKVEKDIPQIVVCREYIMKLKPHILKSKTSLAQTMEHLQSILVIKAELESIVNMLGCVKSSSESIILPVSLDIMNNQRELTRINAILDPLLILSRKQSEELDIFLSTYEQAVSIASSVFTHLLMIICN